MPFLTQYEDRDSFVNRYCKHLWIDSIIRAKQQMRLLKVREQLDDRNALVKEFFLPIDH